MANLNVLWDVWGDRSGYVFIPRARHKPGSSKALKWDEGPAYSWPEDKESIEARILLSEEEGWDVYWCPHVFTAPRRTKTSILPKQGWVYADLDPVDPAKLDPKPTTAWESSPGRYAALWRLDVDRPASEVESLAKRIAYATGGDKGGWDLTQVLRIPGTSNHKYEDEPKGRLLWHDVRVAYDPSAWHGAGDEGGGVHPDPHAELPAADVAKLLKPYRLSPRALELVHSKTAIGDRSERLWELAKLLVEAGVPVRTSAEIMKATVWNKYRGRKDEDHRLLTDALKAEEEFRHAHTEVPKEPILTLEDPDETVEWPVPYSRFVSSPLDLPMWMVDYVWQAESYGLIAGEPKTHKSILATDLGLSVASGRPFLGKFDVRVQGPVLYIQEENHPATVKDRVLKIAHSKGLVESFSGGLTVPPEIPFFVSNNVGVDLTDEDHRAKIEEAVLKYGAKLLILDPLYMMLGGSDENSNKEMRPVLNFIKRLRTYGVSTVLIHHFKKQQPGMGKTRGGQRTRGSSIFHGWTESALYTEFLPDRVKIEREFRSFPQPTDLEILFEIEPPGSLGYHVTVIEHTGTAKAVAAELKKEEMLALLEKKGADGLDLDTLVKLTKSPATWVKQWVRELVDEGMIEKKGGGRGGKQVFVFVGPE